MKIKTTIKEIMERANWNKFCNIFEINPWCLNEGLADGSEEVEITIEQAQEIGLQINLIQTSGE